MTRIELNKQSLLAEERFDLCGEFSLLRLGELSSIYSSLDLMLLFTI